MKIITKEMLAETMVKNVLSDLWAEFINDKEAHEECVTFDEWVWFRLSDLGEAVYEQIGAMYGDLDDAAKEVGLNG
jgi:hypothetical protein